MRKISLMLLAIMTAIAGQAPATAQQYPSKPIRIISPFAPGGGNDNLCRTIAPHLAKQLGQQVVVENRPGANGAVGTEIAARSAPDGYTIVLIPSGHAVNAAIRKNLPFDPIKDFTPITLVGSSPLILAVHPSLPVRNVKELIAFAKARPGQLAFGSAGVGSSGHLGGALFETLTGTKLLHVPYKGMSLAIIDLMSGQVSLTFGTTLSTVPHVRSGRLRALAVTSAKRSPALKDLPTVAESGVPGYEAGLWYGFVGPARIPAAIVRRLHGAIVAVIETPEVRKRLSSQALDPQHNTPEEFLKLMVSDLDRWAKVVKRAGIETQ